MKSKTFKPSQNLARKKFRALVGADALLILVVAVTSSVLILAFEYVLTKFGGVLFLLGTSSILAYQIVHQRKYVESLSYELTNAGIIIRSGKKHKSVEIVSWESIDSYQIVEDKLDKNWNMRSIAIYTSSPEQKDQILEGLSRQEALEIEDFIENKIFFHKNEVQKIQN